VASHRRPDLADLADLPDGMSVADIAASRGLTIASLHLGRFA